MMKRPSFKNAALLSIGMTAGLVAGRLLWHAGPESGLVGNRTSVNILSSHSEPGTAEQADGKSGGDLETDGTQADRVAKVLESLRAWQEAGQQSGYSEFQRSLMAMIGLNSEDCVRLLKAMEEEKMDGEAMFFPIMQWATLDPGAALDFALGSENFRGSERIISAIIHEMAKRDMTAAKAAVERLTGEEKRDAQGAITRLMQKDDPAGALAYAKEAGNFRAEEETLDLWAKRDPLTAAARLEPGRQEHRRAVETIAQKLGGLPDRTDFETWSSSLTDPGERAAARRWALRYEAAQNPGQAAADATAWLTAEPEAGKETQDLPTMIAQRWWWAKGAPAEISGWASSLPAGPARDAAVKEVGRLWVDQDAMAASAWLNTLSPGAGRDEAVQALVEKIAPDAPDEAFAWARTLGEAWRGEMLKQSVRQWAAKDPAAAETAITGLPPEHRGNLLEIVEKVRTEK